MYFLVIQYAYLIFFIISLSIIGSSEQVFADHTTVSVSIPQGTSVPGCESLNKCFIPHEVTIDVGGEVTWSNDDSAAHTVTSGSAGDEPTGFFDSILFMAGTTFSHKFDSIGTFSYHCTVHPWMEGTVNVEESPSPQIKIDARPNQISFDDGDKVLVNGKIKNYDANIHSNLAVAYRVTDPSGIISTMGHAKPNSYGAFSFNFIAGGNLFELRGDYPIQLIFGSIEDKITIYYNGGGPNVPLDVIPPKILQPKDIEVYLETFDEVMRVTFDVFAIDDIGKTIQPTCKPRSGFLFGVGETIVKCTAKDSTGNFAIPVSFTVTVNPPETTIPDWIKNVAEFWCQDRIDDASFIEGIQYLIVNGIIVVPSPSQNDSDSQEIPQWVKNNACWWSEKSITDKDFASGIEFLVRQGIIRV